jgi:oligopeptide transport system substrate-binding protein
VDAARQRLAQAGLLAVALLAGCGSSEVERGGPTLRLALPVLPRTLDPALASDLPSLNVSHDLYAGLTRFTGNGVVPDLAASWGVERGGLVWTFHLRKGIRWNDGRDITADDFRRAWLRALEPRTRAPFAGPELGILRGARRFHASGRGPIGVEAPDPRTLRVTLQHPVPWFDELVAFPVSFPWRDGVFSGPFRLRSGGTRLVLERNAAYWNARSVKPKRLVLTASTQGADIVLPRGLAAPGLPWIETAPAPRGRGWKQLPTLAVHLLWMATRRPPLSDAVTRAVIARAAGDARLDRLVPSAMPGANAVTGGPALVLTGHRPPRTTLTLAYTRQDSTAAASIRLLQRGLAGAGITVTPLPFPTLSELLQAAGPPPRSDVDLVLLGWSSKLFDAYNILDLFPCASAFNVAQWCDRSYDALMRRAVRTLDDQRRWNIESRILQKLRDGLPAMPLAGQAEYVRLKPGVQGFSWSPIGFYELSGLTRS